MVNTEENEALPKSNSNNGNGNNGPRVSFNRDVHVKRYGSLLNNDILNYDSNSRSQSPNLRREFVDLTDAAALEREAALVLEQVNNFGSLPHRKQQQQQHLKKPLRRSKSDASSSKRAKRNSIFNFFNSTPTTTNSISQANNNNNPSKKLNTVNNSSNNNGGKRVTRSKSDTSNMQNAKRDKYRNKVQLNSSSFNGTLTSSDSSDNNNTQLTNSLKKKKIPLSPISEVNTPLEFGNATDYFSGGENLTHTPKVLSKSMEAMAIHSSQMPVEKPPLTKNMKVDKMVKRLSMERLSPPPANVLQAGGFSYTNPQLSPLSPVTLSPNKSKSYSPPLPPPPPPAPRSLFFVKSEQSPSNNHVVYTQLANNDTTNADEHKAIQSPETVPNTQKKKSRESAASPTIDFNDQFINLAPTPVNFADRDETDNNITAAAAASSIVTTTVNDEPIIKPNIRKHIPRYSSNSNIDHINNYYLDNEFDRLNDMRETDFNGIDASLSSRREILESRIKSRIGGLQHINNNENHHTRSHVHPPTTQQQQPPYSHTHKYDSNEIINRYSPERKQHHEFFKTSTPLRGNNKHDQNSKVMHMENGSMRKNSYRYNEKTTDSGNETDNVTRNNYRNRRYGSRFNIGRKWNYEDDIIECELFLMKERKHTEETYPYQLVRTYVYRQHSNNDDQYDTDQDKKNILKEWKHNKKMTREFLKSQKKKKSGLEKVKELFKSRKSSERNEENELKARYREYSPEKIEPPQKVSSSSHQSIINRRRLSTPQASPIIPNRSKSLPPKAVNRNVAPPSNTSTLKREKENNAQKFNWFASLERLSRRKNRDTSDVSTIDRKSSITRSKSSSMKNVSLSNGSSKTLRFFGDTDADETDSIRRLRSSRETREKSSSLQNLNSNRKSRQSKSISRSRQELLNIAESTSDEQNTIEPPVRRPVSPSYNKFIPPPRPPKSSKLVSSVSSTLPRAPPRRKYAQDNHDEEITSYRDPQDSIQFYQKKNSFDSDSNFSSARRLRESLSVSRENLHRDRFDSDASQRSVVYLHASVVGDIPSQTLNRRMSGKSSVRTAYQEEQPSTRTVNRSFSLAAPWKPKFMSDGYEINYNNDQQKVAYNKNRYRSKSATREREKTRWDRRI